MTEESKSDGQFVSRIVKGDSILEVVKYHTITGREDAEMEARVEGLLAEGRHVIDYQLTINSQLDPSGYGWILHRETTK